MAGGYDGSVDPLFSALLQSKYGLNPQQMGMAAQASQLNQQAQNIRQAQGRPNSGLGVALNGAAGMMLAMRQRQLAQQLIAAGQQQQKDYDRDLGNASGVIPKSPVAGTPQTGVSPGLSHFPDQPSVGDDSQASAPDPQISAPIGSGIDLNNQPDPKAYAAALMSGRASPSVPSALGTNVPPVQSGSGTGAGLMPGAGAMTTANSGSGSDGDPALLAQILSGGGSGGATGLLQGAAAQGGGGQSAQPLSGFGIDPQSLNLAQAPSQSQGPPQGFPGAAGAASSPRIGPPVSPQDRDALIRVVYGEARGEPPQGQAATAAVALNRSILSGKPVSAVVNAPGQFEGMRVGAGLDPNSGDYQRIAAVVDPLLSGTAQDPSGGATHFYAPAAQAALGRAKPSWDDGSGRMIGNQLFFNKAGPGAYQVAQNGPLTVGPPSTPSAPNVTSPSAGLPAPQSSAPIQYGPGATPQETEIIQRLLSSNVPVLRERAEQMMMGIMQRRATPPDFDARWDANTGTTVYTPKTPGMGQEVAVGPPQGWRPSPGPGMQYGANGVAQAIPGTGIRPLTDPSERAAYGISPQDRNAYAIAPDGKVTKSADAQFGAPSFNGSTVSQTGPNGELHMQSVPGSWSPAQVLEARNNLMTSKPVTDAREAMANYGALQQLATQPGGTKAYAFRDALARIFNPGGIARTNQIELLMNSSGVPDSVKQYFGNMTGDGNLDPRIAQQGLDAAYAFAKSRADQVAGMNSSNAGLAQRHGLDPRDLSVDLDPLGAPTSLPGQRSAYAPPSQIDPSNSIAAARNAIARGANRAVVIQRLQAAGINPAGL